MSLFDDLSYSWTFKCQNPSCGANTSVEVRASDGEPSPPSCCDCGWKTQRIGFTPVGYNVSTTVQGEKNGRIYYETRDRDGNISRISKTKKDWQEKGINKSGVTREYSEHMKDKMSEVGNRLARQQAFHEKDHKVSVSKSSKKEYNKVVKEST